LTLYRDGSNVGSSSISAANAGGGTGSIGVNGTGGNSTYFPGDIDEVGIWSKALSTQEITDLYNGGAGQTMCNGTGGPLCSTPRHHIIIISLNWKPEPIA
jgi:hypothetical protein